MPIEELETVSPILILVLPALILGLLVLILVLRLDLQEDRKM